jgi:hypothetical protein
MTDRRSGASKSRLKSIAKLARDDEDTTTTGRKKKAKTEKGIYILTSNSIFTNSSL